MDKLGDVNNYHDLQGLSQLKAQAKIDPGNDEALKKAAEHFESIFIGMLLKSMRKANSVFEEGNPMHSNTTNFYRDMYDQQLATDMASRGSLGLSDLIVQQLGGGDKSFTPADVLRNDTQLTRPAATDTSQLQQFSELNEFQTLLSGLSPTEQDKKDSVYGASLDLTQQMRQAVRMTFENAGLATADAEVDSQADTAVAASNASKDSGSNKAEVNFEDQEDFVTKLWGFAKDASSKIGVSPAVILAQSALETGWGKHIIKDAKGDSSFNLFNVKAHRDWDGPKAAQSTLEFEQGVAVRKTEPFRVYQGFNESFTDFVNFLTGNGRYSAALEQADQPEQFLHGLQQAGYATDPKYADKILGILNSDIFKAAIGKASNIADSM